MFCSRDLRCFAVVQFCVLACYVLRGIYVNCFYFDNTRHEKIFIGLKILSQKLAPNWIGTKTSSYKTITGVWLSM